MRLAFASDHAGFALKQALLEWLNNSEHQLIDLGTYNTQPVDYPDYAEKLGLKLLEGGADRGILICGSGVGASVAANKLPGIRAGLCHDTYSAHQGVEHDNMNVLTLGARVIGVELAKELVRAFVGAQFSSEERHRRRVKKIQALENKYCNVALPKSSV
jgi:ribose 5-phosphate isomerase B